MNLSAFAISLDGGRFGEDGAFVDDDEFVEEKEFGFVDGDEFGFVDGDEFGFVDGDEFGFIDDDDEFDESICIRWLYDGEIVRRTSGVEGSRSLSTVKLSSLLLLLFENKTKTKKIT